MATKKLVDEIRSYCARQKRFTPARVAAKFGIDIETANEIAAEVMKSAPLLDYSAVARASKFQSERDFQQFIVRELVERNGFRERVFPKTPAKDGTGWRREFAVDSDLLFEFLESSQGETMEKLRKILKGRWRETVLQCINREMMKKGGSLLYVLKHGVEIQNLKLDLMYRKPEHPKVKLQAERYAKNVFSVSREVWASDKERIDLVVFVNGIAVISFELKCNSAGQGYLDAVNQFKDERDPKTRLFAYPAGCLVNFAMDLDEVYMTTRLNGKRTVFLPFNRGKGKGVNAGAGNEPVRGKYAVSYMWEDILTKDTITELVMKFMFFEVKDETDENGRKTTSETLIFPRYHQLDCVRRLLADVRENGTSQNYLIEHSAGSGKTNTIAWLAHRLASLHDEDGVAVDDNVIIVTDRVVVDRQLQRAIKSIDHKDGLIKVMDEDCTSEDLARAINGNTKIIATTIQKFPFVVDKVGSMEGKHFGVIIDEAHSSTSGKDMIAVTKALGLGVKLDEDATGEEVIQAILRKHGKQKNVSMFAFTATPKPETLQLFGTVDETGRKGPFHLYSMKQAIEEKFILDVLQSFVGYKTYFEIVKKVEDDPFYKQRKASSKMVRYAMLHPTNVEQRTEVIVEHFRTKVIEGLGGAAKAMVVTSGRKEAAAYYGAIRKYLGEIGLSDSVGVFVAFSGSVKVDGKERTEASINGVAEKKLPDEFRKVKNRILVVANKYQTGFDEKRLSAMYVIKGLSGIAAVQTLSRLNRICGKTEDKKTFILDFVNSSDDIVKAFAPYYTTTVLAATVTPAKLYKKLGEIEDFGIIDDDEVCEVWKTLSKRQKGKKLSEADQQQITYLLDKAKSRFGKLDDEKEQGGFLSALGTFCKWYEFIVQASQLDDANLYRKYRYIDLLNAHLREGRVVEVIDLKDKINARNFQQEVVETVEKNKVTPKPEVALPDENAGGGDKDLEERLSEIIRIVNSRYSKHISDKVGAKAILQVRDMLLASPKLAAAAKANTLKNFKLPYYRESQNIIADSYDQNREFFELLLKNGDAAKDVLGVILNNVYESLRSGVMK